MSSNVFIYLYYNALHYIVGIIFWKTNSSQIKKGVQITEAISPLNINLQSNHGVGNGNVASPTYHSKVQDNKGFYYTGVLPPST